MMHKLVLAAGLLALAGCATQQQVVHSREDLLAAAGFTLRPANTPERVAELAKLPPLHVTYQQRNGKLVFLFGDPDYCCCLYIGTQQAYQNFRAMAFQQQVAQEQVAAAQMSMDNWNWGPWGPGWW